ncbi:MAG: RluA family pseudouridine synthase [Deltaproteobacteria bacterium]|nr:RluA family pseudouridine synthase [Deltaproteobacteria bacterium]
MPLLQGHRKNRTGRETLKRVKQAFQVPALPQPERLDKFLIQHFPRTSRGYWREALPSTVLVNGRKAQKGMFVSGGEAIELSQIPPEENPRPAPNPDLPLRILYEDERMIAVDKPAGMPCHPLKEEETGSLVNAMVGRFPEQADLEPAREAGLVHRLDNDTSGVVLFARDPEALEALRRLSQEGGISKTYLALVEGHLEGKGKITHPIAHSPKNAKRMLAVTQDAKSIPARPAETAYEVLEQKEGFTLVRLEIHVGQRHQIRVHLASLGHPIVGDILYGAAMVPGRTRHLLHAAELRFQHPFQRKSLHISASLPEDFQLPKA